MPLNRHAIEQAIQKLVTTDSVARYLWIQDHFLECDVTSDRTFQKNFNRFYRIRQQSESWYGAFFECFEQFKDVRSKVEFSQVLKAINERTKRFEASFSSKILATIDPSKPVLDKFVLQYWNLKLPYAHKRDRFDRIVEVYQALERKMLELLTSVDGQIVITIFDERLPQVCTKLSSMKKLDLILWQQRS